MKKQKEVTKKFHLTKDTLRHLSERDLKGVVGGETTLSDCVCPTESCSDGSCFTWRCC